MIGIYGGSFDPVHNGHLYPVREVAERLALTQVRYIPTRVSPYKDRPNVSDKHRLRMLELALQDSAFEIDVRELERDGPSYTIDTLQSLREIFPEDTLVLMMGLDSWNGFSGWKDHEKILQLAHVVVMTRPGYQQQLTGQANQRWVDDCQQLQQDKAGLLCQIDSVEIDVSSTEIRHRLAQGESVQQLLPEQVLDYIKCHSLYRFAGVD